MSESDNVPQLSYRADGDSADGPDSADAPDRASEDPAGSSSPNAKAHRQTPPRPQLPSRAAVLASVAKLMPLVGAGVIPERRANAVRAYAETLLKHLPEDSQGAAGRALPRLNRLREALHANPDLLDAFQDVLTDEQLAQLVDDEDGERSE